MLLALTLAWGSFAVPMTSSPAWAADSAVPTENDTVDDSVPQQIEVDEGESEEAAAEREQDELNAKVGQFSEQMLKVVLLARTGNGVGYSKEGIGRVFLTDFYNFDVVRNKQSLDIDTFFPLVNHEDRLVEFREKIVWSNRLRQIYTWVGGIGTPTAALGIFAFPVLNNDETLVGSLFSILSIGVTFICAIFWEQSYNMKYAPVRITEAEAKAWVKTYNRALLQNLKLTPEDVEYIYQFE